MVAAPPAQSAYVQQIANNDIAGKTGNGKTYFLTAANFARVKALQQQEPKASGVDSLETPEFQQRQMRNGLALVRSGTILRNVTKGLEADPKGVISEIDLYLRPGSYVDNAMLAKLYLARAIANIYLKDYDAALHDITLCDKTGHGDIGVKRATYGLGVGVCRKLALKYAQMIESEIERVEKGRAADSAEKTGQGIGNVGIYTSMAIEMQKAIEIFKKKYIECFGII